MNELCSATLLMSRRVSHDGLALCAALCAALRRYQRLCKQPVTSVYSKVTSLSHGQVPWSRHIHTRLPSCQAVFISSATTERKREWEMGAGKLLSLITSSLVTTRTNKLHCLRVLRGQGFAVWFGSSVLLAPMRTGTEDLRNEKLLPREIRWFRMKWDWRRWKQRPKINF